MSGLLTEDRSEIKVVPDERRSAWERHAMPDYWCGRCGHDHRVWSKIGERHRNLNRDAIIAAYRLKAER